MNRGVRPSSLCMLGEEVGLVLDSHLGERHSHEPPTAMQKVVSLALLEPPQSTVKSYHQQSPPLSKSTLVSRI